MKEPKVEGGILFEPQIEFILLAPYHVSGKEVNGKQTVTYDEGKILWNGRQYDELVFEPLQESVFYNHIFLFFCSFLHTPVLSVSASLFLRL